MATSQVETVSTGADKAKVGAAVALVIAAVAGFYLLGRQGQLVQWGALVVGLAAAVGVFLDLRVRQGFVGLRPRCLAGNQESRVADPQGSHPDDGLRLRLRAWSWRCSCGCTDKTLEWVFYDLILGWKK